MISNKPVKSLEEIVLPYTFTPPVDIEGGANGQMFYFKRLKTTEVTLAQFSILLTSDYGKYLY